MFISCYSACFTITVILIILLAFFARYYKHKHLPIFLSLEFENMIKLILLMLLTYLYLP